MQIFKYIIYGIIIGLINPPLFDSTLHIFILDKVFNTTIFNDQTFPLFAQFGFLITILINLRKDIYLFLKKALLSLITKKDKKTNKDTNKIKIISTFIISTIPIIILKLKIPQNLSIKRICFSLLLTSILLFIFNKKSKTNTLLTLKHIIILSIAELFHILLNISHLITLLFACKICKIKKETALKISFIRYFFINIILSIINIKDFIILDLKYLIPYILGTIITAIFSHYTLIYIKQLTNNNKLWKLSLYFLILSIFLLYWFR